MKQDAHRSISWVFAAVLLTSVLSTARPAVAQSNPYVFSYGGRLANSAGEGIPGPVDLEVKFFRTASGGTPVAISPIVKTGVPLVDGIFQIDVDMLTAAEAHLVFSSAVSTWIEITDKSNNRVYPRQRLTAVPFAMKVPVDGKTIGFDSSGSLHVGPAGSAAAGEFLTSDGAGSFIWATPASSATSLGNTSISGSPTVTGQVLKYDGTNWTPGTMLPADSGHAGKFLKTDGSGNQSWDTPAGAGDITGVTAGTGLTGGASSGNATLNVDVGTAANKVLQLDANAKIPAVNGSLLTNVNAATITDGQVTLADIGANGCSNGQIIKTNGSTWSCSNLDDPTRVLKTGDTMTGALNLPANGLVLGTSQLVTSGGNVGIGTATPGATLHVNGTLKLSGGSPGLGKVLTSNATGSATWESPSAGGEINTASNVGIGGIGVYKQKSGLNLEFKNINAGSSKISVSNDPGNNEIDLDVTEANLTLSNLGGTLSLAKGGTGATTQAAAANAILPNQTGNGTKFLTTNGTDVIWDSVPAASVFANGQTGALTLGTNDSNPFTLETNNAARITISSAGMVGIGIPSPSANLHVNEPTSAAAVMKLSVTGNAGAKIVLTPSNAMEIRNEMVSGPTQFFVNTSGTVTEAARIQSDGKVGIGTITPSQRLDVNGNIKVSGQVIGSVNASNSSAIDFNVGNVVYHNGSPGALTLNNMQDYTSYKLILDGGNGAYSFAGGLTCMPGCPQRNGVALVLSLVKIGTNVYIDGLPVGPKTAATSGNSASCTVSNSLGNIGSTGGGSGNCSISFTPVFTTAPVCTCSVVGNGSCAIGTVANNGVNIITYTNDATPTTISSMFHLICLGI